MRFLVFIFLSFLTACASYDQKKTISSSEVIKDVDLNVSVDLNKFDYIDEHMDSSLAPALMFGAIGYVALASYNEAHDGEKRQQLKRDALSLSYADIISQNISSKLKAYNINVTDSSQIKLNIETKQWGLRRINRDISKVRPFFDMKITGMKNGQEILSERKLFLSDNERYYREYQNNKNMLRNDFNKLAKKLSDNIAYNIIYK